MPWYRGFDYGYVENVNIYILSSIVLTPSSVPSPWVTPTVFTRTRGTRTRRSLGNWHVSPSRWRPDGEISQWWHGFQHLTVLTSHMQVAWSEFLQMSRQWHFWESYKQLSDPLIQGWFRGRPIWTQKMYFFEDFTWRNVHKKTWWIFLEFCMCACHTRSCAQWWCNCLWCSTDLTP